MTRAVTFWNDETIALIRENFVAASVPTWVCRSDSPEGEFLRKANIHKQWVTSSGYMSCVTADGRLLGRRPSRNVLEAFEKLPAAERKPGAIKVPGLKLGEAVIPAPPQGGLVLKVHARFLANGDNGQLRHARTTDFPLMRNKPNVLRSWQLFLQPNTEYMWLTRHEWQAMVPTDPIKGSKQNVDATIAQRMARFHLTPQRATTSEGGIRSKRSVKTARLELIVKDVTPQTLLMDLRGHVHWGSAFDKSKATTPNGPLDQGLSLIHI